MAGLMVPQIAVGVLAGRDRAHRGRDAECETGRMPVLEPNPQNGQKKLLLVLGAMLGVTVIVAIIASHRLTLSRRSRRSRPTAAEVPAGMVGLAPPSPRGPGSGGSGWITGWERPPGSVASKTPHAAVSAAAAAAQPFEPPRRRSACPPASRRRPAATARRRRDAGCRGGRPPCPRSPSRSCWCSLIPDRGEAASAAQRPAAGWSSWPGSSRRCLATAAVRAGAW